MVDAPEAAAPHGDDGAKTSRAGDHVLEDSARSRNSFTGWLRSGLRRSKRRDSDAGAGASFKARSSGARRGRAGNEFFLLTELENGAQLFWCLDATGIRQIQAAEASARRDVVSFTASDLRVQCDAKLSAGAAKNFAIRATDSIEDQRVINRSARGLIYATPESRIQRDAGLRLTPGVAVVDELLAREASKPGAGDRDEAVLTGVVFEGQGESLAVLYAIQRNVGCKLLVAVNPDNLSSIVESFVSRARLPEGYAVTIFTRDEFFEGLQSTSISAYPVERDVAGVPLSRLKAGALMVAAVSAAGATGWAGTAHVEERAVLDRVARVNAEASALMIQVGERVSANPLGVARAIEVDMRQTFSDAEAIWQPGAVIETHATVRGAEHRVTTRMMRPSGNTGSDPGVVDLSQLLGVIKVNPGQCRRGDLKVTGEFNEVQVVVLCSAVDRGLGGLTGG